MQSLGERAFDFLRENGISSWEVSAIPILGVCHKGVQNHQGQTPLLIACKFGRFDVAQWLFGHGSAEEVQTADEFGVTPIHAACENGFIEIAQWLLSEGASVRGADSKGATPMFSACMQDHINVVRWLFEVGAAEDVRKVNTDGRTPMFAACANGNLEMAKLARNEHRSSREKIV